MDVSRANEVVKAGVRNGLGGASSAVGKYMAWRALSCAALPSFYPVCLPLSFFEIMLTALLCCTRTLFIR
jgi:hypothetical protein